MSTNFLPSTSYRPRKGHRRRQQRSSKSLTPGEASRTATSVTRGHVIRGHITRVLTPLLLLLLLCTCVRAQLLAQQNAPSGGQGTAQVYTGNEAPLCFDTQRYQNRAVESYPILQFLGARCAETTKLTATRGLYRFKDAHPQYPEYQRLPLDIYFQPKGEPLEELYHINTGSAAYHITLPMRYEGTYYVVIRDQTKPSVLIVNSVTLEAEFRRCCALTESIIPEYLHRK